MDITLLRTFSTTRRIKTGAWSRLQPVFLNGVSPCMDACPASIDVPKLFHLFLEGREREAALLLLKYNPFPSITGRVCPHPCQDSCNRGEMDGAVEIRAIERVLGDIILEEKIFPPKGAFQGPSVAVVGSGPAGLSAAWYLSMGGMDVTVFERERAPGGVLSWGIPAFRLDREIVTENLRRLEEIGVEIVTDYTISPEDLSELHCRYQGVLIATGLGRSRTLHVRGVEHAWQGLNLLKGYHLEGTLPPGERAVVIGGGNVAVDVARVLVHEGRKTTLVCVEPRDEMPAIPQEIQEAQEEGIDLLDSYGLEEVVVRDGMVAGVRIGRVCIVGEEDRMKQVAFVDNVRDEVPCDLVVLAVGQEPEEGWEEGDATFVAGDLLMGPGTVAGAIASGRDVALKLVATLQGRSFEGVRATLWERDHYEVITFQDLNPSYFVPLPPGEVKDRAGAMREAERCFSCGYCNACGNCWIFCPDVAIIMESAPQLDPDHCKGCGICATECPRGVIYMREKGC